MKIYFAFSIRGERSNFGLILEIYNFLKNKGNEISTEFNIISSSKEKYLSDFDIFKRDIDALEKSDILLADVNNPSLGVGYEIAHAINKKIKVIAFAKENVNLSAMINGNPDITLIRYKDIFDLKEKLSKYF